MEMDYDMTISAAMIAHTRNMTDAHMHMSTIQSKLYCEALKLMGPSAFNMGTSRIFIHLLAISFFFLPYFPLSTLPRYR